MLHGTERPLGVLQVLDRSQRAAFSLREMDLLGLFADQATIALELVQSARRAHAVLTDEGGDAAVVLRLAAAVDALEGARRGQAVRLLEAADAVLRGAGGEAV